MKTKLSLVLSVLAVLSLSIHAQDWNGIPVPANAGNGKVWQLQSDFSDSFNYTSSDTNRPAAFTNKWVDTYHNAWTGPGLTQWNKPQAWHNGSHLAIQAQRAPDNKVYCGIISSKKTVRYPVYLECRAKIMDQVLANAFWLLSRDDTQEIDVMEGYGSSRPDQTWFAERMHLSHHVFIRPPNFQDYQPSDPGSWHYAGGRVWRGDFHRYGCYWKDPWTLEYYIDGVKVRTVSGRDIIDPNNFTNGTGLNKPMTIIIDAENQTDWRPGPTDAELADDSKNIFWVDWVRVYKPVNGNGGNNPPPPPPPTGGGNSGAPIGKTIWLKANNGAAGYVAAERGITNAPLRANRNRIGQWEKFKVENAGNGKVHFKALANNKYVQARLNDGGKMLASTNNKRGWETFTWESRGNGKVALKAFNNKYVQARLNLGTNELAAIADNVQGWETFNWGEVSGGKILKTSNENLGYIIYPNPANPSNKVTVENVNQGVIVTIHEASGAMISTQTIDANNQIDISNLSNGVYFVKINNQSVKLVVD